MSDVTVQVLSSTSSFAEPPSRLSRYFTRWRVIVAVQSLDFTAIVIAALATYPATGQGIAAMPARYFVGALIAAAVCLASFAQGHLYEIDSLLDESRTIKSLLARWTLVFLALAATAAFAHTPDAFSRLWFLGFYAGGAAWLVAQRSMVGLLMRRWIRRGFVTRTVAVVGGNALSAALLARLAGNRAGIRVIGVFDERESGGPAAGSPAAGAPGAGSPTAGFGGQPHGNLNDLLELTKHHAVDLVILTLPIAAAERLNHVIRRLREQPLDIRLLPGEIGLDQVSPIRLSRREIPGVQLIVVADRPMSEFALLVKGAFDRTVAAAALILLAPLFVLIAAVIVSTSPGPAFFRQPRVGYRGRIFRIYKFRTMRGDQCGHAVPTAREDERIFSFGRLLRKASLDELPQLINVLQGDMSLVGPRPHMVGQTLQGRPFFEVVNEYAGRHRVKPGITGWAQVNGWRGPTETLEQIQRRVEHDIYYVENWSLILDAVIILKTFVVGFVGRNAF
jgi:Undecaprenyl-phosphate glucose phosphotransferase